MGEEDRLVRRLGAGHAGEVFEAVLEGKVYALKLFTHPEKYNRECYAYAKLNIAFFRAKKQATEKAASEPSSSNSAATAKLNIILYSFCQETEGCFTQSVLRNYGGSATQSCFLSHAVRDYWLSGLRLEMLDGPTLDDKEDRGTGAVTTVLRTEGQRRRVWERLRNALEWLHREAKMVHGSVHGRNVILVRVADRMKELNDAKKEGTKSGENGSEEEEEEEEEEGEEEDYMPVLIDFNHARFLRKDEYTEEDWRLECLSELDKADRLLPMVALKDMKASQGKMIKSDDGCEKAKASVCGTCLVCLSRRLNRLKTTVRGMLGNDGLLFATRNKEIAKPMLNDAFQVAVGIDTDIYREPGFEMGTLKPRADELLKELADMVQVASRR